MDKPVIRLNFEVVEITRYEYTNGMGRMVPAYAIGLDGKVVMGMQNSLHLENIKGMLLRYRLSGCQPI
jgi:hypothetical protein